MTIQEKATPKKDEPSHDIPEITVPQSVKLKAPRTLEEGETIWSSIDGIDFWARAPKGGVKQFEFFESPYPTFIKVQAPDDFDTPGDWFLIKLDDGVEFQAIVPEGGCREGDLFETLHPSVSPPVMLVSSGSPMFRGENRNCILCAICGPLLCCLVFCFILFVPFSF